MLKGAQRKNDIKISEIYYEYFMLIHKMISFQIKEIKLNAFR